MKTVKSKQAEGVSMVSSYNTEELGRLLDAVPAMVFYKDRENRFVRINSQFIDIVGFPEESVIGKTDYDVFPAQAAGFWRDDLEIMMTGRAKRNIVQKIDTRHGSCWVKMDKLPWVDENGKICGVVGFSVDITAIRKAEEALRIRDWAVQAALDPILFLNLKGHITYVNPAFVRLWRLQKEKDLNGKPFESLFSFEGDPVPISDLVKKDGGWTGELFARLADDSLLTLRLSSTLVTNENGKAMCIMASLVDITEQKTAEKNLKGKSVELERTASMFRQFAYISAHDLQEPLRMVASYTQLLAKRYRGQLDQEADEYIEYAVEGATRMHALINDLLAFFQITTSEHLFQPTNLETVVNQLLLDWEPVIAETGAKITRDPLPSVLVDPRQIGQLYGHLLSNAIKFHGRKRPAIHFGAERMDGYWTMTVRDNGIGIDRRFSEPIFEIFKRLHNKREYSGTGIGLAICKKIVERHGGRIWMESEPGKGSVFYFSLPVLSRNGNPGRSDGPG
jgi:PAS domain S-box-containing protein